METTWLAHHTKFVDAWVGRHQHFGNIATSRAEGAHSTLKSILHTSNGDLVKVGQDVLALMRRQASETTAAVAREAIRTPQFADSSVALAPEDEHRPPFTMNINIGWQCPNGFLRERPPMDGLADPGG